jgi:hypothetical protein
MESHKVAAYDKQGKLVGLYKSLADAERLKPGHLYLPFDIRVSYESKQ